MADKFTSKLYMFEVEANQVQEDTYEAVALWCGGLSTREHDALEHSITFPAINVPCVNNEMKRAQEKFWVVKYPAGYFDVLTDTLFRSKFEPIV